MPLSDANESPLERAEKRLYAPRAVDGVATPTLSQQTPGAPEHWQDPELTAAAKPRISNAAIFLGIAAAFFVVAGAVTAAVLFLGGRSVSSDHVTVSIEAPTTVAGGEDVSLLITVRNENPVSIQGATLSLQFPDGTTGGGKGAVPLANYTDQLGDIPAGGSVRRTIQATFFGTENQKVRVPVTVEYRTEESNAVFVTKDDYTLALSTSPIGLSVTTLSEIASGQQLTLSVLVRSNANVPLENVAVRADYPFGFTASSATPEPYDKTLFPLGTLMPGDEREIRVTGLVTGYDGDQRVFRFTGGALKAEGSRDFSVAYTTKDAPVAITRPFFAVDLAINRSEEPSVVIKAGEQIGGLLTWANEMTSTIQDGVIAIAVTGDALDSGSVDVVNGFYRSSDRTMLFDRDTAPGLARLDSGDTGNASFTFVTKKGSGLSGLRNPVITLSVSVSGRRVGQGSVAEKVTSTLTRTLKLASDLTVEARAVRTTGPFENTGPWPPEADKETTYTILLSAANTVNSVANASARMTLPSYVRFTGQTSPTGAVKYNDATREVIWTMGDLAPEAKAEAAFQLALLPSVSQKGTSPTLTSATTISGHDRFVQQDAQGTAPAVTTETKTDPKYQWDTGVVK